MKRLVPTILLLITGLLSAQQTPANKGKGKGRIAPPSLTSETLSHEERLYKTTPQGELRLHFSFPKDWKAGDKRPAIVFFFGGGWKSGSYLQFVPQSDYFASRGLVAASADYRISSIHKTTPDKCVEDAKSAVRYLRAHSRELGIDPGKIISAGGSAGGHLAACTALISEFDAESDDKSVSAKPNAMVLFNPALNIDELAANRDRKDAIPMAERITPNRHISADTPPAIMFFGTDDALIEGAQKYLAKAVSLGLRAELWTAEGQAHGFFNRAPWTQVTAKAADEFLASLGYLNGESTIKLPEGSGSLKRE
ncbi:MAG: alpha/beta hydrolase [Verrucomicrobiaceae bacterium]|nr:alpha/beta hydrolase [Verrucomicrobiaceae bacterium]